MSWGAPLWRWACLALPLLAAVLVWAGVRHQRRIDALFRGELRDRVLPRSVRLRRGLRDVVAVLGLACLIVALAEPRYGKEVREVRRTGVDLVLVVDLSLSMDAQDVDPSRLERARREIVDLIGLFDKDRVGLVVYAAGAFPRMPLTVDHDALGMVVDELDTSMFQAQGSEMGEALRLAATLLGRDDAVRNGKAIVLFSDGEAHDPGDALAAAEEVASQGVRVYTVGIGVEPAPIPLPLGGFVADGDETVLSEPNRRLLRDLARATGGAFVPSEPSARDMEVLYRDEIRATLQATEYGAEESDVWKSGFQWPLGVGLVLWLFSAWLGDGRRRWGGVAAALLAVLVVPGQAVAGDLADGDGAYRDERYIEAQDIFTRLALERPTDPDVFRRLGAARYRMGDYEGAAKAWAEESALRGRGERSRSDYDAGNAYYQGGHLEEALDAYDRVLNVDPDHPGAAHNRQLVRRELAERRMVVPEPQGDPQSKEGSDGGQTKPEKGPDGEQQRPEGEPGEPKPGEGDPESPGDPTQGGADPTAQAEGGQPTGEAADAEAAGDAESDTQGNKRPGDDGQELDGSDPSGIADMDELSQEAGDERGQPFDGSFDNDGPVTEAQAERLLEGVEEGRPRIRIPARARGKPW